MECWSDRLSTGIASVDAIRAFPKTHYSITLLFNVTFPLTLVFSRGYKIIDINRAGGISNGYFSGHRY